jgi:tryptophan synthase alpha chain
MSKISNIIRNKKRVLNIYLTAGYPQLNDTIEIVQELENAGIDLVEIGMPFTDPLADGPTIQESSKIAIENGITIDLIFKQIQEIQKTVKIPILLMGYYNQVLTYGEQKFFENAKESGINGFIIPDLPIEVYTEQYKNILKRLELDMVFLITPQTENERILKIDAACSGFLYMVSSYALTGNNQEISQSQIEYFERVQKLGINNPKLIGFGISDKNSFDLACQYADGAIIGSAFIKALKNSTDLKETVHQFVKNIRS